jgi:hypothetical protein
MSLTRIVVHNAHASIEGRYPVPNVTLDEVEKLFIVYKANALYEGGEPFFAILFPETVWIVPAFEADIQYFLERAAFVAQARSGIFRVNIPSLPWAWRRRAFGLLPVFSQVDLGAHPRATIPSWKAEGPLALASAHELGLSKMPLDRR